MLELYGLANSRAFRCLWMLEEVGVPYKHIPLNFLGDDLKDPTFLAINPNGRIPCLVDDDLVLFESLAINLYLARRYSDSLWPEDEKSEARLLQWTLWAANELEPLLSTIAFQLNRVSEEERDHAAIESAKEALLRPLGVLDSALESNATLAGPEFCVADLNVASVLVTATTIGYDFSTLKNATRWFQPSLGRPAGRAAAKMAIG